MAAPSISARPSPYICPRRGWNTQTIAPVTTGAPAVATSGGGTQPHLEPPVSLMSMNGRAALLDWPPPPSPLLDWAPPPSPLPATPDMPHRRQRHVRRHGWRRAGNAPYCRSWQLACRHACRRGGCVDRGGVRRGRGRAKRQGGRNGTTGDAASRPEGRAKPLAQWRHRLPRRGMPGRRHGRDDAATTPAAAAASRCGHRPAPARPITSNPKMGLAWRAGLSS